MTRYTTRSQPRATLYVEDQFFRPETGPIHHPSVDSHEAVDTGLITVTGEAIMRLPNPIGFGRDGEW